ncbi:MAG: 30S ribosomal protein S12 methylthiotransferase RimO [Pirellulales bacterium]|nr:30S ribosomal protein S12 methylthiotransferase RimO [Pirellulales bacterium]
MAVEKASHKTLKGTYSFISLGCPKNLVDSERMLGLLQLDGYELVEDPKGADFAVVNTCGFIEQARDESYAAIDEMLALKKGGDLRGVVVSGCLADRQKEELLNERPEIDSLVGVFGRDEVTRIADRLIGNLDEQQHVFRPAPIRALNDTERLRITPQHFAYLKISEGCDRLCTFCDIPRMRGKHATKPIEDVLAEAKQLADDGVKELIIVAQDTTYYGMDLYGEPRLKELLDQLETVEGIEWIRLMYFYPMYITDELIATISQSPKIVPYIDMPLQHINDNMLRRMSRRVNRADTISTINRLRDGIDSLTLRTTLITGFPGETDEEFNELLDFVQETQFDRLGAFTYSYEEMTPSAKMDEHIAEEVKVSRMDAIMSAQRDIMQQLNQDKVGTKQRVIIDRPVPDEINAYQGRSQADAPDIDGTVFVTSHDVELSPGDIVDVEVVAVTGYDLVGITV